MAQGDGDGISRVIRLGHGGKMQQPFGHVLHLMLGGAAVAHNGLLDLHGLIFKEGDAGLPDGKQNDTPALGHIDAGGDVLAEEQFFNGHHIRLGHPEQFGHIVVNHFQAPGKFRVGRSGDGTAVQEAILAALGINQAEAGDAVAGVNAEDPHYRPAPAI